MVLTMQKYSLDSYLDDNEIKELKSWDYNLDFKSTYKLLVSEISDIRRILNSGNITINKIKKFTNLIVGLTQLRNGSRVGEAIEGIKIFCIDKSKRVSQVRVQKRKDDYFRKIVLPDEIAKEDLDVINNYVLERSENKVLFVVSLSKFFQKHFKFSTHALRYSWISYMAYLNEPAQLIAKVTGHKTLNLILHYTQRKLADLLLLRMSTQ
jgi:integrase